MASDEEMILERLARIEGCLKKVDIRSREALEESQKNTAILRGDDGQIGLVARISRLEEDMAEFRDETLTELQEVNTGVKEINGALVGKLNGGKREPGLMEIVRTHEKAIRTIYRFAWLIIGAAVTLAVASIWNTVLTVQKLTSLP